MKLVLALKLVPKLFSQHHTAFYRKKNPAYKITETEEMLEKGGEEEALDLVSILSFALSGWQMFYGMKGIWKIIWDSRIKKKIFASSQFG